MSVFINIFFFFNPRGVSGQFLIYPPLYTSFGKKGLKKKSKNKKIKNKKNLKIIISPYN
jgi:hypothetical protein